MSARGLSFSAVFSVFYFAIILGAVAVSPVFAALPIADWTYSVSDSVNSNAFVAILDSARVAAVAYQPSYDTIIIAGRSLDGSQEQLWTNANVCQNAIAGLAAYPHAQDPDALIVVACETHLVALNPTNGSVVWDISIGQGGALSLQGPSNVAPLPLFIAPAAGTRTSRFVVPLYPSNNGNGGSTLTLLGVVDPVSGTVGSADVPCFGTVQAIHDGGAADVIVVSCAPGDQGTGTSTLKAFSTANGRLDALWQWTVPQHAGLSVAGVAGPGAASTDFLAMVYVAPYNSNNGNGYGSSFTWYFRVDAVTGTRWNITDMRGSAPYAPASNDQVLTAVSAGAGSFAFWAAGSLSFATLGGSGNASYLDFTAATVHTQQYPSTYQVLALAGVPFATARHFAAVTQNTNTENVYSAAYDSRGNQRVHALAATDIYNAQATGLRVSYCPDTLRVLLAGASQVSGYEASATGAFRPIFSASVLANSVGVSGSLAVVGTSAIAVGFSAAPGASWTVTTDVDVPVAATYNGVTYVADAHRVHAYGPAGTLLWKSASVFGSQTAVDMAIVGESMLVVLGSGVVAVDAATGRLLFDYTYEPPASGPRCVAPSSTETFTVLAGAPIGVSAKSAFIIASQYDPGQTLCSYLVRADGHVVPMALASNYVVQAVAPNGNFILGFGSTVAEIDRWTGDIRWQADAADILVNEQQTPVVMSGETVAYLFGYSNANQGANVLQCYSRSNGALLWSINGNQNTVESIFAVATDDIIVTLYDSSGTNDLTMLRNTRTGNTASYEIAWQITSYQPVQQGVLLTQGVVVVLSEYGPTGYNCEEQCLNGFDVTTGTELWGVLNTYGQNEDCNGPITPLMTSPPRGVMLRCSMIYALDAWSGAQLFSITPAATTYGINGDVLVQVFEGGPIQGLAIPPGPLIAFATNASKSQPMPARFDPPFVPPTPPAPPTPVPVPPMPSVPPARTTAVVDWTFVTQGENGCVASTVPVDGVYLGSGQDYLYFVSASTGATVFTADVPGDCNSLPVAVVSAGTHFVVQCSTSVTGFFANGTQKFQTVPTSGGLGTLPIVPVAGGSVGVPTGNGDIVLVSSTGAQTTVPLPPLPTNTNPWSMYPPSKTVDGCGLLLHGPQGLKVAAVRPDGSVAWTLENFGSQQRLSQLVDGLLMPDLSAIFAAMDNNQNLVLLRVSAAGNVTYQTTGFTSNQLNDQTPIGVLTTGLAHGNDRIVVYTAPEAQAFLAIDVVSGRTLWRYGNADPTQESVSGVVGAAITRDCAVLVASNSDEQQFVACLNPITGHTRSIAYIAQLNTPGGVSASQDPATGEIVFVANQVIGLLKLDNTVAWTYTGDGGLQYDQFFATTTVVGAGTPQAGILAYILSQNAYDLGQGFVLVSTAAGIPTIRLPSGTVSEYGAGSCAIVPQPGSTENVSVAAVDGKLLYLADAQTGSTLWKAGVLGTTPLNSVFGSQFVFHVGGRVVVARSTGVVFFDAKSGEQQASVGIGALDALCTPPSGTAPTGWVFGEQSEWLLISRGRCVYSFKDLIPSSYTIVGGLGAAPVFNDGLIIVTNAQGSSLAIDPAAAVVAWVAAPPPSQNGQSPQTVAQATGGTSIAYSVGTGSCVTARYALTGKLLWQACFPAALNFDDGSLTPLATLATESLLLVNGANGLIAIDPRLSTDNSNRLLWTLNVNPNYNNGENTYQPQYSMGVAVAYYQGTLIAAGGSNGTQLWTFGPEDACSSFTVAGRYALLSCGAPLVVDITTGRRLVQQMSGAFYGIQPLPPVGGHPRIIIAMQNDDDNYLDIARIAGAQPAVPPAPPLPVNATIPAGFVPEVPQPTQGPPSYQYDKLAPYGMVDWTWPHLTSQQVNGDITITPMIASNRFLLQRVGGTLMAADTATRRGVWNATIPQDCRNDNFQFGDDLGGSDLVLVCGQVTFFLGVTTGNVTRGPNLLLTFANEGATYSYTSHRALPNAHAGVAVYSANVWNSNQGEYVYTYGVVLFSANRVVNHTCITSGYSSTPPVANVFTDQGRDTLVVQCPDGNVTWLDGASGRVLKTLVAANQTTATTSTADARFIALLGSSTLSATQIAIVDTTTRAVKAVFGTNPPLPAQTIQLVRGATDDELLLINTNSNNVSVTAYTLDLRNSGSVVSETWWSTPFGSQYPYSVEPMASFVCNGVLVVTSTAGTAFLEANSGRLVSVVTTPSTDTSIPTFVESAGVATFQLNSATVVFRLSDGQLISRGASSVLPVIASGNCLVAGPSGNAFSCFSLHADGWARFAVPQPSPGTVAFGTNGDNVLVTSLSDVTAINVTSGNIVYSRGLPSSAALVLSIPDLVIAFSSTGSVWTIHPNTGTVEHILAVPLCQQAPAAPSQFHVTVGKRVFVAGQGGCVFMLDATDRANPTVKTVIDAAVTAQTSPGDSPIFGGIMGVYWLDAPYGQLTAIDATTGASKWAVPVAIGQAYRVVLEYGVFVYAVAGTHTVNVHRAVDGVQVASVPVSNATLFGTMRAFNGRLWLPTLTGVVSISADPVAAMAGDVRYVTAFTVQTAPASTQNFGNIKISPDGVAVVVGSSNSAGIDTFTGAVLWATSAAQATQAGVGDHRPDFTIDGDVVVGGVSDDGFTVRGLRSGVVTKRWTYPQHSSYSGGLGIDGRVLVAGGYAMFANYYNLVAGLPIGPAPSVAPVPTATAPANSDVPTAPPPTPVPTGVAGASLGCVRRIDTETALLRACVSSTVVAPLYEGRAAGVSTLDCARGAPALASCVANYAATMAGCGAGIAYLREVLASINATGAPLAACGRAGVCTTAAGEAAFCAALDVPSWAAAAGPLPATGLPPIPTFTSAAATTTSVVTTTTLPTTTTTAPTGSARPTPSNSPSSSPRPTGTSGPSGSPQPTGTNGPTGGPGALPAVIALQLEAGATIPTGADIAMSTKQALGLTYDPDVELFGMLGTNTVLFAFRGADASSLTQRTLALSATSLHVYFHSSKVTTAAPPDASPAPAGKTPGWVIPVVIVLGVLVVAFAAIFAVKRKQLMGSRVDVEGPSPSINSTGSAAELHSGRIQTGGEYTRYEDMA